MSLPMATLLDIWERVNRVVQASVTPGYSLFPKMPEHTCLPATSATRLGLPPHCWPGCLNPLAVPVETLKLEPSEMPPAVTAAAAVTEGVHSPGGPVAALVSRVCWIPWGN